MKAISLEPGRWEEGQMPDNVRLGAGTLVRGGLAFKRFHSKKNPHLPQVKIAPLMACILPSGKMPW